MNYIQKFDAVSEEFRAQRWISHSLFLFEKYAPLRAKLSYIIFFWSTANFLALLALLISKQTVLQYSWCLLVPLLIMLIPACFLFNVMPQALVEYHGLRDIPSQQRTPQKYYLLVRYAKKEVLKRMLFGDMKPDSYILANLKNYLENLLAELGQTHYPAIS